MPSSYVVEWSGPINDQKYIALDIGRTWVRNPKPYALYYGGLQQFRRLARSGVTTFKNSTVQQWAMNGSIYALGNYRLDVTSSAQWSVSARNKAVGSIQSDIAKNDFNLGITGAEASKTAATIANLASRIAKAALAVKRGNIAAAAKHLGVKGHNSSHSSARNARNNAASHWLELQYGWKPLLNDVRNACKTLAGLMNQPDADMFISKARGRQKGSRSVNLEYFGVAGLRQRVDISYDYKHEICVVYRIRSGNISTAAQLGLTNPFSIAWEIVPFSFVVDWFVPVGRLLSQLSAYHGLEFVRSYETSFTRITYLAGAGLGTPESNYATVGHYFIQDDRIDRWLPTGFPYLHPVIQNPFTVTRAISAVALIQSVLGGFGKR